MEYTLLVIQEYYCVNAIQVVGAAQLMGRNLTFIELAHVTHVSLGRYPEE